MRAGGFSVVELMVVAAILVIIAAVAMPQYGRYAERGYRVEAQADLLVCAQGLERYAAVSFGYTGAEAALAGGAICAPRSVAQGRYRLSVEVPEPDRYVLTATPLGTLAGSGVLIYHSSGERTLDGARSWEP
jgi:type IV pilus assembly protein PilE